MTQYRWLHLGLGSFHRAHQACYFNSLLQSGNCSWTFAAANIRDDAERTVQGMLKQNSSYTLKTISPQGAESFTTIKAISQVFPYTQGLPEVIYYGSDSATKVISFTVTEVGYYLDASSNLDLTNNYIAADLKGGLNTIYGVVTAILLKRMESGEALTLLCCDNVRENGEKFHHGLVSFISNLNLSSRDVLLKYVADCVTTPNTMVDRITPRPEEGLSADIKAKIGVDDLVPVMSESFIQWVIEDKFASSRPDLESVGVQMVDSVLPYEDAKLRILNASHSCLAWAGVLKGLHYVFECARDKALHQYAYDYITNGVIPCLKAQHCPIDLPAYRDSTLERFCNEHIRDTLERIAQDSFSKLYTFIKPTLLDCYKYGVAPDSTVFLAALYFVFLERLDSGYDFDYQDSSFDRAWWDSVKNSADPIAAYANTQMLFDDLGSQADFVATLKAQIECARAI